MIIITTGFNPFETFSQNGSFRQVGMNIKNLWNHHPDDCHFPLPSLFYKSPIFSGLLFHHHSWLMIHHSGCRTTCWIFEVHLWVVIIPLGTGSTGFFGYQWEFPVGLWFQTHRIHGTNGIFTYIWHEFMVNVRKYTSPMDPMGKERGCQLSYHIIYIIYAYSLYSPYR